MPIVVLHRLRDWPAFTRLRPLLRVLGVHEDSFDYWHWFTASAEASATMLGAAPERGTRPHEAEALFAAGQDVAASAPELARLDPGDAAHFGFHDAATRAQLAEAAAARGDVIVWVDEQRASSLGDDAALSVMAQCADLDGVASRGEAHVAQLFEAMGALPRGARLTSLVVEAWCRRRLLQLGARTLEAGMALCRPDVAREIADELIERASRGELACRELMALARWTSLLSEAERAALAAAVPAAVARHPSTLLDLYAAHAWGALSEERLDAALPLAFRAATDAGFTLADSDYGDAHGFAFAAPRLAVHDPDLVLRGWARLTARYNESGLDAHATEWDRILPRAGYSSAAIFELAQWFGQPSERGAARRLRPILRARGIEVVFPTPPPLDQLDVTVEVGTDVGHLALGSSAAIDALANAADPADWPGVVRAHRSVCVDTGADGTFVVRVLGRPGPPPSDPDAVDIGTFALRVTDDALVVCGVVGAGGAPTLLVPSGDYAATVRSARGVVSVIIHATAKRPRWRFGAALPRLPEP